MKTIKGPAIFLAQFAADEAPFNTLDSIAGWASGPGFKGAQVPSWDGRFFSSGASRCKAVTTAGRIATPRWQLAGWAKYVFAKNISNNQLSF